MQVNLSTRPEKSVGTDAFWELSEAALVEALGAKGWGYVVDEGGGAFYGPKIDIKIQDAIGRKWQCSTVSGGGSGSGASCGLGEAKVGVVVYFIRGQGLGKCGPHVMKSVVAGVDLTELSHTLIAPSRCFHL